MLERVCGYLHNYFVQEAYAGDYSIVNGTISLDFLKEGQRFWIYGSTLNDGVYTWHEAGIKDDDDVSAAGFSDEDFSGEVCALAVPPVLLALVSEMRAWETQYGEVANSPYQSESVIGVYSYTKANGTGADAGVDPVIAQFKGRLSRWRKVCL